MKAQGLGPTEIAKTLSIGSGERLSCVGGRSLTRPQIRVCVPEAASIDRFGHDAVGGFHYLQGLPERTGVERQFHDSLAQPQIFRFEKRKETYWLGPGFNIIPLMRFPVT